MVSACITDVSTPPHVLLSYIRNALSQRISPNFKNGICIQNSTNAYRLNAVQIDNGNLSHNISQDFIITILPDIAPIIDSKM